MLSPGWRGTIPSFENWGGNLPLNEHSSKPDTPAMALAAYRYRIPIACGPTGPACVNFLLKPSGHHR
jgi:hypothetical protein